MLLLLSRHDQSGQNGTQTDGRTYSRRRKSVSIIRFILVVRPTASIGYRTGFLTFWTFSQIELQYSCVKISVEAGDAQALKNGLDSLSRFAMLKENEFDNKGFARRGAAGVWPEKGGESEAHGKKTC